MVELVVVVTVLALLLSLLLPALRHARARVRVVTCAARLKQNSVAIQSYVMDQDQHYPLALGLTVPWQGSGYPGPPYANTPSTPTNVVTFALCDEGYLTARVHNPQYDGEYRGITTFECTAPWTSVAYPNGEGSYGIPHIVTSYSPSTRRGGMNYMYFAFGLRNRNPGGTPNAGQPFAAVTYRGSQADELLMQDIFFPTGAYYNHEGQGANALYADLHVRWWDQENMLDWDIAPGPYDPWRLAAMFWPPD